MGSYRGERWQWRRRTRVWAEVSANGSSRCLQFAWLVRFMSHRSAYISPWLACELCMTTKQSLNTTRLQSWFPSWLRLSLLLVMVPALIRPWLTLPALGPSRYWKLASDAPAATRPVASTSTPEVLLTHVCPRCCLPIQIGTTGLLLQQEL